MIYKVSVRAYEWRRRKREHGALEGVKPRRFIEKGFGGARAGQARRVGCRAGVGTESRTKPSSTGRNKGNLRPKEAVAGPRMKATVLNKRRFRSKRLPFAY